jgi:prophage regulatory protein
MITSSDSPERILRLQSVLDRTGLSPSKLYREVQAGTLPAPFKIAQRCRGRPESDIRGWQHTPGLLFCP